MKTHSNSALEPSPLGSNPQPSFCEATSQPTELLSFPYFHTCGIYLDTMIPAAVRAPPLNLASPLLHLTAM